MGDRQRVSETVLEKASRVQGVILDVDGTLTDGRFLIGPKGDEYKAFHVRDGLGIKLLIQAGVLVTVVSARSSRAMATRASELGISMVYLGVSDKLAVLDELVRKSGIELSSWACVGDDILDIPLMEKVGFAVGVADCVPELASRIHFQTRSPGGYGAVREVCELILKTRGQWPY